MDWTAWALLLAAWVLLSWLYNKWRHNYWARRGVPSAPATPLFGHMHKLMENVHFYNDEVYNKYGGSVFSGRYEMFIPVLVVGDPELIKHITIKDFDHFTDHRKLHFSSKDNTWRHMLFSAEGDHWKRIRNIMTPSFSSGKIKGMFNLVNDRADAVVKHLMKKSDTNYQFDPSTIFGGFSLDAIASCAFGFETNTIEDENPEFKNAVSKFFDMDIWVGLRYLIVSSLPLSVIKFFDLSSFKNDSPEMVYLQNIMKQSILLRKEGIPRGDFIDGLLDAQKKHPDIMQMDAILSQSMLFIFAGYHTTAVTSSFAAYYIAKHPHYQERLRQELHEKISEHGSFNYQAIMDCTLLDAVIEETQRMASIGAFMERECTKDYKLPNSDVTISKGTVISIPVWSLHHDPRYWPEPNTFKPERFFPENKNENTPFTFLPFGTGPRMCIASRFAQMELKILISKLLLSFSLELVPGKEELQITQFLDMLVPKDLMLAAKPLKK
ncbi:unnamed protein product [Meganyctiphanes norvegica]|uniref:Cytochrome P450 n=1 Tax=Meganyctiphanes norvegica TaxID=48144 RepID=A0AAV2QXB3_MEGNR